MCLILALAGMVFSLYYEDYAEGMQGQKMLRFTEEITTAEEIESIQEASKKEEGIPQVALWKETEKAEVFCEDLERTDTAVCIALWGDVEQVFPGCLSAGNGLIKEDDKGCMVSEALAYRLFGSGDVLGKELTYEGSSYVIRGILDLEDPVFLREDGKTGFPYMEVREEPGSGMEQVRQILARIGRVPEEGAVIEADMVCGLLRFAGLIPAGLLLFLCYRILKKRFCGNSGVLWILRIAVLALCLAGLGKSWCFSDDVIPSRWSDFEFFGELFRAQGENIRRYLRIPEIWKDGELFRNCMRALSWTVFSTVCVVFGILTEKDEIF